MEKEKYISIVNLFWKVLFAWRAILLGALIFAIIVPSFAYIYDKSEYTKKVSAMMEMDAEEDQVLIDYTEKENLIKQLEMYEQVSFYVNANPTNVFKDKMIFTSTEAVTNNEMDKYVKYFYSDDFVENIFLGQIVSEEMKDVYILAVCDVIEVSYTVLDNGRVQLCVNVSYEDNCTIGETELYYKDLVNVVKDYVLKENAFYLISHNIEKINVKQFKEIRDAIKLVVYDYQYEYNQAKTVAESKNIENIEVPQFSFKLIFVGGLLGIIIVCVCVFVKELFTNRLQDIEEISDFYDIQTLGVVQCEYLAKKKNKIDSFLYKLKNHNVINCDEAIELAITNVKVLCDKSGIKDLYVSSSEAITKPLVMEEYKRIVEGIRKQGINVIEGNSVLVNAKAHLDMCEAGTILFVETVDKSRCKDIEAEIQKAQDSQVSVLGCVVLY